MGKGKPVHYGNFLLSLSDAIDLANSEIVKHQQRTAYIAWEIAKAASLSEDLIKDLFVASLFHDVGALTVEEKTALHSFHTASLDKHCIRGEILINTIPQHERIASIVRFHHTEWQDWEETIDKGYVQASQILFLADYVERLVDRNHNILVQRESIIKKAKELDNISVYSDLLHAFLSLSGNDEFWLNLGSPRLYTILNKQGPLNDIILDNEAVEILSKFCRDVVDYKSPFTASHSAGVAGCVEIISKLMGYSDDEVQEMTIAANLHDIGKMIIPNSILEKPGRLTHDEYTLVASHAYYSHYVISTISGLQHVADAAAFHHERLDGTGYPFHCYEQSIPSGARIMAVADIYAAMTEKRPYRAGKHKDKMVGIMGLMAASHAIDKDIVNLMSDHYSEVAEHVEQAQREALSFYENHIYPYDGSTAPPAPKLNM